MSLTPWMRIGQPLEPVMRNYKQIFDGWEAGGVRGLVFGRLVFMDKQGKYSIPAFPPNQLAYTDRGLVRAKGTEVRAPRLEKVLHAMLEDAKKRGWTLLIFGIGGGASGAEPVPIAEDPYGARALAAVWDETLRSFPEVDGGIMDAWTEHPYELSIHHTNPIFKKLSDQDCEVAELRGYDAARLNRGRTHLATRFTKFTASEVRYYGNQGLLSALNLFDIDEDTLYWLRWRRQSAIDEGRVFRHELDQFPRHVLLGNGVRSAVFSGMTGFDFSAWDEIVDLLLVKHYFWHRGYDGMYGTIARWVRQVQEWNPGLTEQDCWIVVKAWLGIDLPEVSSLADMDMGFPQSFFDEVVVRETTRALASVSEPEKLVPWVDTGRMPHGGDPMTSGDLARILEASDRAGLQRFVFHNHAHLTAAEWRVISRMCGIPWDENPEGYWPPNTLRPKVNKVRTTRSHPRDT